MEKLDLFSSDNVILITLLVIYFYLLFLFSLSYVTSIASGKPDD